MDPNSACDATLCTILLNESFLHFHLFWNKLIIQQKQRCHYILLKKLNLFGFEPQFFPAFFQLVLIHLGTAFLEGTAHKKNSILEIIPTL